MEEAYFGERGLHYRKSEMRPERPTLVFLHGLSGSLSVWGPYEKRLGKKYNLVSLDLRGHGKSKRWSVYQDYDLRLFAEDVSHLLQHVGVERYTLVAHSFGTLVALELFRRPHGIEKLLLLSPNYAVHRMLRARLTRWPLAFVAAIFSALPSVRWRGNHLDYSKLGYSKDWDMRRLAMDILNTGIRTYVHCLHRVYSFTRDEEWRNISVPTRIMHGAGDSFIPIAHAIELADIIPNATFEMVGDGNHMLVLNNIPDTIRTIDEFAANTT